ncbi:MAG: cell division protein FtsW [Clostridia bacterium]|nr:cell division protein FtsW [Clostridia bacterium]MBQ1934767.1 cell division protein FtsW [Clostridia bacterium]MBQ5809903.1 cell division protein FtsW [Clostridia bacterium]MBR0327203.1 cell division protein FtsW [Clostridia bacterium]
MRRKTVDPRKEGRALLLPNETKQQSELIENINHPVSRNPEMKVKGEVGELTMRRSGFDTVYFVLVLILLVFGSIMVFSASYADALARFDDSFYFARKQLGFVALAMCIMPIVGALPYKLYYKMTKWLYLLTLGLLLLVLVIGFAGGGAQRWFSVFGVSVQPSEIAKVTLVMTLASFISRNKDRVLAYKKNRALSGLEYRITKRKNRRTSFLYGIVIPLAIVGCVDILVMLEKHISGLAIITMLSLIVMFYAGSNWRWLVAIGLIGASAIILLITVFPYAVDRVLVWRDPYEYRLDGGWQTIQGLYAIGSGGPYGLGLGQSRLKYSYVSQPHNDFIFTIVCEELGFIGAVSVMILFGLLVWRGMYIAKKAPDAFASITAFGISAHIAIQVLLNIAVVTNTIPNTGISLPFFSYGGSSLLVLSAEMGIMLSISRYSYIRK